MRCSLNSIPKRNSTLVCFNLKQYKFPQQRRRGVSYASVLKAKGGGGRFGWGCEIDSLDNAYRLQKWLDKEGLPPQKLAIQKVDVGGRGLVALKNVRRGEKLLYVPQNLIITTDSGWSYPAQGDILSRNNVTEWPFLAVYLISEASLKKSSRWSAYISALPRHPYSILQWTHAEVETYLAASPIKERAIECITDVTQTYSDLQTRIFSKYPDLFPQEVFNLETLKWAFGILFSRLVRLPSMNNQIALVPWADMLNHSSEVDTYLDFDLSSKGIVFAADRAYSPREQVFISYGKKSNGELLLAYGFIPEEGTNGNNSVEILLGVDTSDSCYNQKFRLLQKYGLSTPQRFPLKMTGWPTQLEAYAVLVVSPPSMAGEFEKMAVAASNRGAVNHDMSHPVELKVKAFHLILASCETSISKYTAFLEKMQEIESTNFSKKGQKQVYRQSSLMQLSIDLCSSEQKVLFRTRYVLWRKLKDLQGDGLKALNVFNGIRQIFS